MAPTEPRPVSRSELARRARRSKSRISEDCREGGPLAPACVLGGDIDLAHPSVAEWARRRRIDPARLDSAAQTTGEAAPVPAHLATVAPAGEYDALTLRKKRAEVERLELRNARDQGRVISAELVRKLVLAHFDALNRRLLREGADYLASAIASAVKSGEPREAVVERIRSRIGQDLVAANRASFGGLKATVRASKGGGDLPDVTEVTDTSDDIKAQARRSALHAARIELRAATPRVVKTALQYLARHGEGDAKPEELESMVGAQLEAAITQAGRPSHREDEPPT